VARRKGLSGFKAESRDVDGSCHLDELYRATSKLPNNKAPGEDGIIAELMKKILTFRRENESLSSASRMATIVLRLLNHIWRTAAMDNYRGISLILCLSTFFY